MSNKEKFKLIPSVYLLLIKQGKILLLRRCNTGFEDGNYGLVAGHADGNETMREALLREIKEEANIEALKEELNHVLTMHRWCGDHERIDLFFTATDSKTEIKNMETHLCDDLSWFDLERLPENTINYIRYAIECFKNGKVYCEYGWDELK